MKVTVRDCLQMDAFKQAIVVAGEKNLDNRVRSISVMDASCVSDAVAYNGKKEELVLTTFSGMGQNTAAQCEVVRELAKAGVAAVVFFQRTNNDGGNSGYADVIAAAKEAEVPYLIIANGKEVDYSNLITEVMDRVLYGNNFNNALISNTIFHLLNFEKYNNFQQAIKEAAINNDFQVVLLSEEFNVIFAVETRHKTTIDAAIRCGREVALNHGNLYSLVEIDGVHTYWGAVNFNNEKYYLFIVDNEDSYSSAEITKLAEILELAMGMWNYTPERDSKAEFVKALMRGNTSFAHTLKNDLQLKIEDLVSVFYAKGINNINCENIIDKYEEKGFLNVLKINEEDECYGVIFKGPKFDEAEESCEKAVCSKLFDELKEKKSVRIYHSTGFDGIEGACDGFRLISETWSFAGHIYPYKRVFTKYETALVTGCISIQAQGGYLKKNYLDLLSHFRRENDNKAKQLLETLETFVLDAGMNSGKTAEFMGIHTNTVQYRLKKINEILGAEITGNRVIPGLTIALALQRLEEASK